MAFAEIQDRIGTLVADKYRLLRMIGEGGMGAVFEAEHMLTRRRVAVKLIKPEFAQSHEVNARFVQEARTAASIGHKNIVQVLDAGTDTEGPFLVLELLQGETLCDVLDRRPMPPREALTVMAETLDALRAAHAAGVIHRDIKPENIFLLGSADDCHGVKLLDFGISKVLHSSEASRLTRVGTAVGTPDYMSPEQASGSRVDGRADVWSVGAVLYEALTQTLPFEGETYQQLLARIMLQPHTPLGERLAHVPPGLAELIDRALSKNLSQRFASADAMLTEMRRLIDSLPPDHGAMRADEATSIYAIPEIVDDGALEVVEPTTSYDLSGSEFSVTRVSLPPRPPAAPLRPPTPAAPPSIPPPRSPSLPPISSTAATMPRKPNATLITVVPPPSPFALSPRRRALAIGIASALGLLTVIGLAAVSSDQDANALRPMTSAPSLLTDAGAPAVRPALSTPEAHPLVQPIAQPIAQPLVQPIAQPLVQPIAQPLVQPIAQPLTPTVADAGTDPRAVRHSEHPIDRAHPRPNGQLFGQHANRPHPNAAPTAVSTAPVGAPLSQPEVLRVLGGMTGSLRRCTAGIPATIDGALWIDGEGRVQTVRLNPPFSQAAAAPCARNVLMHAHFPRNHPSPNMRVFLGI